MSKLMSAWLVAGSIGCGPARPSATQQPKRVVSTPGKQVPAAEMPACERTIRPAPESTRYWAKQVDLQLWPSSWGGQAPGERAKFVAVRCEIDATGPTKQIRCGANLKQSRYAGYRDIVGKCFERDDVPFDAADGKAVLKAWDTAGGPDQMWKELRALARPATYMQIQIQTRGLAEAYVASSCGPRTDPNAPMCDPAMGPPTGRKIPQEATFDFVVGPPGTPDGQMPFQDRSFPANGVNVGRITDHFEPDPNLGAPKSSWWDYFEQFWCVPVEGSRELRGAVLVNRALGAVANGHAARGRKAIQQLRDLVASGPLQGEVLLPGTLDTLQTAGSSAWLVTDPCHR